MFQRNKDGTLRLCIDYRGLNELLTVKNKYPIPRIDELLDWLHGFQIFRNIDLKSGYYQIKIKENDVPKIAFNTRYEHYKFTIMPFDLTNAHATFKRFMQEIFREHLNEYVLVFFDDILVYFKNVADHPREACKEGMKILRKHKRFTKNSKYIFLTNHMKYLGSIVSKDGISIDPTSTIEWYINRSNLYNRMAL